MKYRCRKCLAKMLAKNPDDIEKAMIDACFTPKAVKIAYEKFKLEKKHKMKVVACPVCKSTDLELASQMKNMVCTSGLAENSLLKKANFTIKLCF